AGRGHEPRAAESPRTGAAAGRTAGGAGRDAVQPGRLLRRARPDAASPGRDLPLPDSIRRSAITDPASRARARGGRTGPAVRSRSGGARRTVGARGAFPPGAWAPRTRRSATPHVADPVRDRATAAPEPA